MRRIVRIVATSKKNKNIMMKKKKRKNMTLVKMIMNL